MSTNSILNNTSDHFENNRAGCEGGLVYSEKGHISVIKAIAISNVEESDGGVFRLLHGTFKTREEYFNRSYAKHGAVISAYGFTVN